MNRAQPAHNTRKKDGRLLYIMVLASSRFAALVELRTFMASKRDDFFLAVYEKAEVKKKKHDHVVLKDDLLTTELDSTAVL